MARKKEKEGNRFDGYGFQLFFDEDRDWVAHLTELPNVSAFGETVEEALNELAVAWNLVKESYAKENKPIPVAPRKREYSGSFNVRISRTVHRALVVEAEREGVTLNALVAQKLARSVDAG